MTRDVYLGLLQSKLPLTIPVVASAEPTATSDEATTRTADLIAMGASWS